MAGTPLIEAAELEALLATDTEVVLLDVRWALGDPQGHQHYLDGHIPGAVFVDLHHELAGVPSPASGRHPLPDPEEFQAAARRWGINRASTVVVYDATRALAAARAWWLLRHAGFENVLVLNGGLDAWTGSGHRLETGEVMALPGHVQLGWDQLPVIDMWAAQDFPGALLDARAAERYTGETEPIDPRAGHIPGALSHPTTQNLADDGRFLPTEALITGFATLGIHAEAETEGNEDTAGTAPTVASYCGSGVTAAHQILALHTIGITAALYPGSWSQYSADATRPAATGETP
ncbi:sulfurtransferase [Arthrobacter sp. MYb227]|uniref:sulfurtransferase n=1 Tax=Arthrobacter sp. MYb227 TaxID=1848601 RepID=UPI000CFB5BA2|nr:rhodanese-like domain-containing protein [Arthrobacter sp. MYb227]PQZ88560.1 sulfurtransferase [Arthrobacter sp. MYb227]